MSISWSFHSWITGEAPQAGPKTIATFNSQIWSLTINLFFQSINAREQHPAWASPRAAAFAFGAAFACAFGAIDNYRIRPSTTLLKSAACTHEISKHVQVRSSDKDIKQTRMKTKTNVPPPVNPLLSNVAARWASGRVNGHLVNTWACARLETTLLGWGWRGSWKASKSTEWLRSASYHLDLESLQNSLELKCLLNLSLPV